MIAPPLDHYLARDVVCEMVTKTAPCSDEWQMQALSGKHHPLVVEIGQYLVYLYIKHAMEFTARHSKTPFHLLWEYLPVNILSFKYIFLLRQYRRILEFFMKSTIWTLMAIWK
jgi:hypothetical protein